MPGDGFVTSGQWKTASSAVSLIVTLIFPGAGALTGAGHASAGISYAAGRASRSVSSWMSTAIFVRAGECCRL